jgi:hypothetical protein
MLFLRGADGRPRYTADDALAFMAGSVGGKKGCWGGWRGQWEKLFRGERAGDDRSFRRAFGDATLRDTVAPLLVPCYDLATAAPFVFSRVDAAVQQVGLIAICVTPDLFLQHQDKTLETYA